jgi:transposase
MEAQMMRTPLRVERAGAVEELSAAIRAEKKATNQLRQRGVLAVARGRHVPEVAETLGVSPRALRDWVHGYNQEGASGLLDQRGGRRCRLSGEQLKALADRIRAGPREPDRVCSLRGVDIRQLLRNEYNTAYSLDGVYYLLHHQLGMSYLKPRPLHRKSDPQAQEAFKKPSHSRSKTSRKNTPASGLKSGSRMRAGSGNKAR